MDASFSASSSYNDASLHTAPDKWLTFHRGNAAVMALIGNGADVGIRDNDGRTATEVA
jgi:hypothetical protein